MSKTVETLGGLDIVVNNAAVQYPQDSVEAISAQQLMDTFSVNIFAQFYMVKAALPHLHPASTIINTTSVTAYKGHEQLIDYAATKGAIVAFTRSLSQALLKRNIRVNGVAPCPICTPLIPASFDPERVAAHGDSAPMERVGQPEEVAPCYVFQASRDSYYMTGQILHPNGGTVING